MSRKVITLAAAAVVGAAASLTAAQTPLTTVRVAAGLARPVFVTHAPGDFSRVFIVEQRGSGGVANRAAIKILDLATGEVLPTPFLSINGVATGSEQGLLGLAFHPDYANNGAFFVHYSNSAGDTVIARYQVSADPNVADPSSSQQIMFVDQPFSNHNGGWIGFAPGDTEGYLYIALGDGGSANDPGNRAQNTGVLLGKMLRIDVDGPDNILGNDDDDELTTDAANNYAIPPSNPFAGPGTERDEIWAYGLRNPWRDSFDRATGDLYIADVGQNVIEEINFQPGSSAGGENYGWRCMEGRNCTGLSGCTCNAASLTDPIWQYSHTGGHCSITGGYVYRGCAIPDLVGTYFFADYCSGQIWSFAYAGSGDVPSVQSRTAELAPGGGLSIGTITSFGEDAFGEIYITDQGGEVFKIVPREPVGPDCNNNGRRDACDILSGEATDANGNGIPDSCECRADLDGSGSLTLADFTAFRNLYVAGDLRADFDNSGDLTLEDFMAFRNAYTAGCP